MRQLTFASLLILSFLLLTAPSVFSQTAPPPAQQQQGQPAQSQEEPCIPKGVTSLALSPNGRLVLTAGPLWGIRLFDMETGKELRRFKGHDDGYMKVAFAPNGHHALSYSFSEFMYLWDVESGREIRRFAIRKGGTESASFTPDGRFIVIADDDAAMVRVLDVESAQEVRSFKVTDSSRYDPLNISPNGRRAVYQTDEGACLWDTEAGRKIRCFQASREAGYFALYDRYAIFSNSMVAPFRLLDVERDHELPNITYELKDRILEGISADGRFAIVSNNTEEQAYRLVDLRSGREFPPLEISKDEIFPSLFAFTADGLYAVAGSGHDALCVWDVKSGKRLRCFKAEIK